MPKKLMLEEVKKYVEENNCILISEEYKGLKENMEFKCACGNNFTTTFDSFKNQNKHQCNECSKKQIHDKRAYSYEYIKNYIENLNSELLSETYNDNHEKIKVRCNKCGKEFETTFNVVLRTVKEKNIKILNCKKCNCKEAQSKNLHTIEEIRNFVNKNSDCKLLSTEYKSNKTKNNKLKFKCSCGNEFNTTYYRFKFKNKRQCNTCSQKEKWTIERAKQWVLDNSDCILLADEIKNSHTNMLFQCHCGNKFETSLSNFRTRRKRQCNDCSHRSNLEAECKKYFEENNIIYTKEKTFDDCRNPDTNHHFRYDFYLPDYNLLIECHGIQHRKPYIAYKGMPMEEAIANFEYQKYRDKYKKDYAKNNKYDLLYIWYYELDNISNILTTKLKLN